ncbi:hypothetical protein MTP04_06060 [Lysinibacillus sp. PLM2]|nr:hypothetical protein MTP04_06060 [Lysinibacillus sp. PLM2]
MNFHKRSLSILLATSLISSQASIVSASETNDEYKGEINSSFSTITSEIFQSGIAENEAPAENQTTIDDILKDEAVDQNGDTESQNPTNNEEETQVTTEIEESVSPYIEGNGKVVQSTPYYFSTPNGFVKVGTIEEGVILKPTRVSTNYFIINAGNKVYYIPRTAFTSTKEKTNIESHLQGSFPRTIVAENDAEFKDKSGNVLGSIAKGQQVKLHMVNGGRGVIELFGKRVYVDLSDFKHINQVLPKKNISYKEMEYHIKVFSYMYPEFSKLEKIGASVEGRPLYALKIGNGKEEIIMDASMHAREHMTTNVLLEMIDEYTYAYINEKKYGTYNVKALLDKVSIWYVPMMNPDGVTLVQTKANSTAATKLLNKGSVNYNRWKANIRGVDLNRNFDGGWITKASTKYASYKNYKGTKAFSEPESRALRDFVAKHKFKSYISYHSSGSVLYYFHHQTSTQLKRDLALANSIKKETGYSIMPPTGETGSGASTDWFIMNYKMPGITVEIAPFQGETVVSLKYWDSIWKKNKTVGLLAATEASLR